MLTMSAFLTSYLSFIGQDGFSLEQGMVQFKCYDV